jgi:hypothetical protein
VTVAAGLELEVAREHLRHGRIGGGVDCLEQIIGDQSSIPPVMTTTPAPPCLSPVLGLTFALFPERLLTEVTLRGRSPVHPL